MKTLQKDLTTPEQSKKLLELGVPKVTANYYYYDESCYFKPQAHEVIGHWKEEEVYAAVRGYKIVPLWSVGRLMEILMICNTYLAPKEFKIEPNSMNPTLIENVVNKIEELEGYDMLDFSKLEE